MNKLLTAILVWGLLFSRGDAGLFTKDHYYVVIAATLRTTNSFGTSYPRGWICINPPKNENGVYIFNEYRSGKEFRIPVQGTLVIDGGTDITAAQKVLGSNIVSLSVDSSPSP